MIWLPVFEKMATQVDCFVSLAEIGSSVKGVVGSLSFLGVRSVMSTR
jgi:hypothetical protein